MDHGQAVERPMHPVVIDVIDCQHQVVSDGDGSVVKFRLSCNRSFTCDRLGYSGTIG